MSITREHWTQFYPSRREALSLSSTWVPSLIGIFSCDTRRLMKNGPKPTPSGELTDILDRRDHASWTRLLVSVPCARRSRRTSAGKWNAPVTEKWLDVRLRRMSQMGSKADLGAHRRGCPLGGPLSDVRRCPLLR